MDSTINCTVSGRLNLFFFLFLIFLASAFAFDCSTIDNSEDCLELQDFNANLIPDLMYKDHRIPNHDFITNYNNNIEVQPTQTYNSGNIRNAWLEVPYIYPSIIYDDKLLSNSFHIRGDYDYSYNVPSNYYNSRKRDGDTCRIRYYFHSRSSDLEIYSDDTLLSTSFSNMYSISKASTFKVEVDYSVTIRERHYEWDRYCCRTKKGRCVRYCYDCDYDYTSYDTDSLTLTKTFIVNPYQGPVDPNFIYLYEYNGKYWGNLIDYDGNMKLCDY